jgi:hypothetical protein
VSISLAENHHAYDVLEGVWPAFISLEKNCHGIVILEGVRRALISLAKSHHALARLMMYWRVSGQHRPA